MQHGRCSDVCNNLWLADRELAHQEIHVLRSELNSELTHLVAELFAFTRNLHRRVNEGLDGPLQAVDEAHNMAQRVNNSLASTNILMEGFYRVITEDLVRRDQLVDRLMRCITVLTQCSTELARYSAEQTNRLASLEARTARSDQLDDRLWDLQDNFNRCTIELRDRVASLEARTARIEQRVDRMFDLQDIINGYTEEMWDRVASLEAQTGNAGERRSRSPRPRT